MPRSTFRYHFEWQVLEWAGHFRSGHGFLAILDAGGTITQVREGEPRGRDDGLRLVPHQDREIMRNPLVPFIFFDPFDVPEYSYLSWQNVPRAVLESLAGEPLMPEDHDIPATWGVMF